MFTHSVAQVYSCEQSGSRSHRYAHTCRQVQCVGLAVWWTAVCRSVCRVRWVQWLPHFPTLPPGASLDARAHIRGQLQVTIHQLYLPTQKSKLPILEDVQTWKGCAAWMCCGCGSSQTVPKEAHKSLAPNVYLHSHPPSTAGIRPSANPPPPIPPLLLAVSCQLSPPQSLEAIWDLMEKPFIQRLFLRATVNTENISCQQNTLSAVNGFFPDCSKQSFQ